MQLTNYDNFPIVAFLSIGFSHHSTILAKAKTTEERKYYIQLCYDQQLSVEGIEHKIAENAYAHRGQMPNNFSKTIADYKQAFRAIQMFKDEYLLDYINVEPLGVATYKTSQEQLRELLPDEEEMKKLMQPDRQV